MYVLLLWKMVKNWPWQDKKSAIDCGPSFFSSFIISHRMKLFVFSTSKLIKRTDKLVLIRQRSHAPTRRQLRTKKRRLFIIRWRSSTKRHFRMKKRIPTSVENKKTEERKNYFLAGNIYKYIYIDFKMIKYNSYSDLFLTTISWIMTFCLYNRIWRHSRACMPVKLFVRLQI